MFIPFIVMYVSFIHERQGLLFNFNCEWQVWETCDKKRSSNQNRSSDRFTSALSHSLSHSNLWLKSIYNSKARQSLMIMYTLQECWCSSYFLMSRETYTRKTLIIAFQDIGPKYVDPLQLHILSQLIVKFFCGSVRMFL